MLIGEYRITLDDKGRVSFPAKLRTVLQQNELMITQGLDHCLTLFTTDEWTGLANKILSSASIFDSQKRIVMRRFIGPAQKVEFDKSGRLSIPQSLRDYASLSLGGECVILGMSKYMELWSAAEYLKNYEDTNDAYPIAAESMRSII